MHILLKKFSFKKKRGGFAASESPCANFQIWIINDSVSPDGMMIQCFGESGVFDSDIEIVEDEAIKFARDLAMLTKCSFVRKNFEQRIRTEWEEEMP